MPPDQTGYADVLARFGRSPGAQRELDRWRNLPGKTPVVEFAQALTTQAAYQLTPEQIEDTCKATRHALEDPDGRRLRRKVAEAVRPAVDWHPNFPIVHTMYWSVEHLGRPPLWDELIALWRGQEPARSMLGIPAASAVGDAVKARHPLADAREAVWWRLGNSYYSMLRELYVLAVLRQAGFPVEYHVLADALFRVDFWLEDTVISLYVANASYRDASGGGRKRNAQSFLGTGQGFRFVDMPRPTLHEYGTVHLPARSDIERFAQEHLA